MRLFIFLACLLFWVHPVIAEWIKVAPIKKAPFDNSLGDIESYLQDNNVYQDSDKITWGHEGTHGTNSYLRQKYGEVGYNVFYQLNGNAMKLKEPSCTLRDVANKIPSDCRTSRYNLYMVTQQSGWNDTPLYILDELTSYINGAIVGEEYKNYKRASESLQYALEMCTFALYLPWQDDQDLKDSLMWFRQRLYEILLVAHEEGWYNQQHAIWWNKLNSKIKKEN